MIALPDDFWWWFLWPAMLKQWWQYYQFCHSWDKWLLVYYCIGFPSTTVENSSDNLLHVWKCVICFSFVSVRFDEWLLWQYANSYSIMATEAGISSVQLILQRVIYAGGNIIWTYFDHLNCKKKKKTLNCKQTICCAKQSVQWFPSISTVQLVFFKWRVINMSC